MNEPTSATAEKSWLNGQVFLGYVIVAVTWVVFVATSSHFLEILMGLGALCAAYLGYKNKSTGLLIIATMDAIWMFAWGFGLFGDSFGMLELFRALQ